MPPDEAVNRRVAQAFFSTLNGVAPQIEVDTYDLYASPPPYFDYPMYRFLWYPLTKSGYEPTPREEAAGQLLSEHSARFNGAHMLALTAPVWNYSIPAILKAWIDVTITPNFSFRFVGNGREPLHQIKRLVFFLSCGGTMGRGKLRESLMNQLLATFAFIGITEVTTVFVEGQDPSLYPDYRQRERYAIEQAESLAREIAGGARKYG